MYEPKAELRCAACGRSLRIFWPTRRILCSCGARVVPGSISPAVGR